MRVSKLLSFFSRSHYLEEKLIVAFHANDLNRMRSLLTMGANVNTRDNDPSTAHDTLLSKACFNGNVAVVKLFLEYFPNLEETDAVGETPLQNVACWGGDIEVIRLLLNAGANREVRDRKGKTILEFLDSETILFSGKEEIIALLRNHSQQIDDFSQTDATGSDDEYRPLLG